MFVVQVKIPPTQLSLQVVDRALAAGADKALLYLSNVAKTRARKRTGTLIRSISVVPVKNTGGVLRGAVSAGGTGAPYAVVQDSGSGLYGPRHAKYPIRPKNKKALAFANPRIAGPPGGRYRRLSGALRASAMRKYQAGKFPGAMIVVKGVMHPGVKPDHFLTGVLEQKSDEDRVVAIVQDEIDRAFGFT